MGDQIKDQLFLSHKQSDGQDAVLMIAKVLEEQNVEHFLDIKQLDNIHNLEKEVKSSKYFVVFITPCYLESLENPTSFCHKEMLWAVEKWGPEEEKLQDHIVLIKHARCPFPGYDFIERLPPSIQAVFHIKALDHQTEPDHFQLFMKQLLERCGRTWMSIAAGLEGASPPKKKFISWLVTEAELTSYIPGITQELEIATFCDLFSLEEPALDTCLAQIKMSPVSVGRLKRELGKIKKKALKFRQQLEVLDLADEFYDDCVNLGVTDVASLTPNVLRQLKMTNDQFELLSNSVTTPKGHIDGDSAKIFVTASSGSTPSSPASRAGTQKKLVVVAGAHLAETGFGGKIFNGCWTCAKSSAEGKLADSCLIQVNADGKICANVRLDSSARIARLCMCPNGDVWILSHGGKKHPTKLYWCQSGGGGDTGVREITAIDQSILDAIKSPKHMVVAPDGGLWFCTDDVKTEGGAVVLGELYKIHRDGKTFEKGARDSNCKGWGGTYLMAAAHDSSLWMVYSLEGYGTGDGRMFRVTSKAASLSTVRDWCNTKAVSACKDGLWCLWIQQGNKFGRLCRVFDDNEQQLRSKTDDWQVTKLIAAASDGGCWVMHANGHLCKLSKNGQSFIKAPDEPLWKDAVEMSGTGDGGVWVLSWHSPRVGSPILAKVSCDGSTCTIKSKVVLTGWELPGWGRCITACNMSAD